MDFKLNRAYIVLYNVYYKDQNSFIQKIAIGITDTSKEVFRMCPSIYVKYGEGVLANKTLNLIFNK